MSVYASPNIIINLLFRKTCYATAAFGTLENNILRGFECLFCTNTPSGRVLFSVNFMNVVRCDVEFQTVAVVERSRVAPTDRSISCSKMIKCMLVTINFCSRYYHLFQNIRVQITNNLNNFCPNEFLFRMIICSINYQ